MYVSHDADKPHKKYYFVFVYLLTNIINADLFVRMFAT